ncbi:MAG: hypothetical protein JWO76_1563 [Nocardioides sp.]|jgi:hypothetical protein|nr:hypothetical protein [Nocardioides sp.]
MRMHRIVTGLVAFALIAFVPFVSTSSATAVKAGVGADRSSAITQAPAQRAKPHRKITDKIVQKGLHKLVFKGHVLGKPTYGKKVVKIQRKISKSGHWKLFKKVKSTKKGGVKTQVPAGGRNCNSATGNGGGCWYFRAFTPATKSYAASHSSGKYFTFKY